MSRWDPEDAVGLALAVLLVVAGLAVVGWLLWSGASDRRDMSRCRDRGGRVEHIASTTDWRCVGAAPERAP